MLKTSICRLRAIGFIEGLSYVILLGIAMPLKYFAGMPEVVRIAGWLHGGLFMLYIAAAIHAAYVRKWSLLKLGVVLAASIVPFATFFLDKSLRKEEAAANVTQ
ncbi:MAG: DUF3817 domain-containing protein [Bacteroidota bacterium]|nr:DUF3817 domain-containing protein [Bacteroidota bacterium]